MDAADRIEIHELMALYAYITDERAWSRLPDLVTEDITFDVSKLGLDVVHGIEAFTAMMTAKDAWRPLAHHVGNVLISEGSGPDGEVRVDSKVAAVLKDGRVLSFSYVDRVRHCADGRWRISVRAIIGAGSPGQSEAPS